MSLPFEYFKNMEHITDLQKLKDDKLKSIIQEFYKELEKLNNNKTAQLKDLKKLCDETTEILKEIRLILNSYKNVNFKKMSNQNNRKRENINDLLDEIDYIEISLKSLKTLKINSKKVNNLVSDLLLFIRLLSARITELDNK